MTESEVREWLKSYTKIKSNRDGILKHIKELEADRDALQLRSPKLDGMPHSGRISDPTADTAMRYSDVIADYKRESDALLAELKAIRAALKLLTDDEANLLRRHYLLEQEWHVVAADVNRSESGCYDIARKAISKLAEIL